jgi:hypothetical protein
MTSPVPDGLLRFRGNGRPLDDGIRAQMESFFNASFSGVRVHEGPAAQAMGALAFTLGEDLHFAPGLYAPTSREGVELLGHELTHVVQQRDGRAANPYGQGVAIVQDPALEAEADLMGRRVADEIWCGFAVMGRWAGGNVVAPRPHLPGARPLKPAGLQASGMDGGKSGVTYTSIGDAYDEEDIAQAMEQLGLSKGVKGHGKKHVGRGHESTQTKHENARVAEKLRENKQQKKTTKKSCNDFHKRKNRGEICPTCDKEVVV